MACNVKDTFTRWLENGGRRIGQIVLNPQPDGSWLLCHADDAELPASGALERSSGPEAARGISLYDAEGKFRPLKTAPDLRRGWELHLADAGELLLALDFFYPAAPGNWTRWLDHGSEAVPLRTTLDRQTGMYRVTQLITDDEAQSLVGGFCRSDGGCLRTILWPIAGGNPVTSLPASKTSCPRDEAAAAEHWPLLCIEACNLLVADARRIVKRRLKAQGEPAPSGSDHDH